MDVRQKRGPVHFTFAIGIPDASPVDSSVSSASDTDCESSPGGCCTSMSIEASQTSIPDSARIKVASSRPASVGRYHNNKINRHPVGSDGDSDYAPDTHGRRPTQGNHTRPTGRNFRRYGKRKPVQVNSENSYSLCVAIILT
jgi:hypothetical protein